jgi:hypothetical protein
VTHLGLAPGRVSAALVRTPEPRRSPSSSGGSCTSSAVYVPHNSGDVWVIDPATFEVVDTFPAGDEVQHVVPSWDMQTLYATDDVGNTVLPRHRRSSAYEQRWGCLLPKDARRADAPAAQPREASQQYRQPTQARKPG